MCVYVKVDPKQFSKQRGPTGGGGEKEGCEADGGIETTHSTRLCGNIPVLYGTVCNKYTQQAFKNRMAADRKCKGRNKQNKSDLESRERRYSQARAHAHAHTRGVAEAEGGKGRQRQMRVGVGRFPDSSCIRVKRTPMLGR